MDLQCSINILWVWNIPKVNIFKVLFDVKAAFCQENPSALFSSLQRGLWTAPFSFQGVNSSISPHSLPLCTSLPLQKHFERHRISSGEKEERMDEFLTPHPHHSLPSKEGSTAPAANPGGAEGWIQEQMLETPIPQGPPRGHPVSLPFSVGKNARSESSCR